MDASIQPIAIPGLTDLPVVGKLLFGLNPLVYVSLALFVAIQWFLFAGVAAGIYAIALRKRMRS